MPNVPFKFRRVLLDVNVCIALLLLLFLAVSAKPESSVPQKSPKGTVAIPANDFLNSIGVCSSITGRGETLEGTTEALSYTGIRFIRCGLEDQISVPDMVSLHKKTGARIAYGLLSGGTDLDRLLKEAKRLASAGALLALEGNNEPNIWGITYRQEI